MDSDNFLWTLRTKGFSIDIAPPTQRNNLLNTTKGIIIMAILLMTKYVGATNTRSSRIKVTSYMGASYVCYDDALTSRENHLAAIDDHISKKLSDNCMFWQVLAVGEAIDASGKAALIESVKGTAEAVTAAQWEAAHYGH